MHTITNNRRTSRASPGPGPSGPPESGGDARPDHLGDRTDAATSFRPYGPDTDTPGKVGARAARLLSSAPSDAVPLGAQRVVAALRLARLRLRAHCLSRLCTCGGNQEQLKLPHGPRPHECSEHECPSSSPLAIATHFFSTLITALTRGQRPRALRRAPPPDSPERRAPTLGGGDGWGGDGRRWRGSVRVGAMVSALRCGGVARPRQRWRSPWRPWSR